MNQLNVQQTWPHISGLQKNEGTDIIDLIFHKEKPKDRRKTYVRAVCNIISQKTETHRTRLISGGNLI